MREGMNLWEKIVLSVNTFTIKNNYERLYCVNLDKCARELMRFDHSYEFLSEIKNFSVSD